METSRKQLHRWERPGWRFVTFSCHRRLQLLNNASIRDLLAESIASARERCGFRLAAWVIMPEHVHLMIAITRDEWPMDKVLIAIKQPVSQRVLARWRELGAGILEKLVVSGGRTRFWQAGGGFDRNVRDGGEFAREVEYIHQNPVTRGLVERPTEWAWSSARWYAGEREGQIPIDR